MFAKIKNNRGAACMLVCALLLMILFILQFTPFWQYGEAGESCSISSYVWFPSDQKELESWLGAQAEDHDLNSFVGMPILTLVLSAAGAVLCLIKPDNGWTALLPTACGLFGAIGYLTTPALKLGMGWTWHLLLCIALLVLGVFGLVQWIREIRG